METITQEQEEQVTGRPGSAAKLIREVRAKTRRKFSAEDKIRIVLEGFRKEMAISDLCRREGISSVLYYSWLKDFMEAGKARLKSDSLRDVPCRAKSNSSQGTERQAKGTGGRAGP